MSPFRYIILSVLLFTFVSASNVMASMHQHVGHDSDFVSPFDKEQKLKSLHCLLNNHQHNYKSCPHSSRPAGDPKHRLSADCGGKNTGTLSSVSFHKDNIDNSSFIAELCNISFRLSDQLFSTAQQTLNLQDPPPEVL